MKIDNRTKLYLSQVQVQSIVERTVKYLNTILKEYEHEDVELVCVLNGGFMYFNDVIRNVNPKYRGKFKISFVRISSYKENKKTDRITLSGNFDYHGKIVVFFEDIIDTGGTVFDLLRAIEGVPKRIFFLAFMSKISNTKLQQSYQRSFFFTHVHFFTGHRIKDFDTQYFFVGYGMDDEGRNRELQFVLKKK